MKAVGIALALPFERVHDNTVFLLYICCFVCAQHYSEINDCVAMTIQNRK